MIFHIVKEKEYEAKMHARDGTVVHLLREKGTIFKIEMNYKAVYGLGEKFDSVDQRGKVVINQVIEKFCNQGSYSYCTTPFFVTDAGIGIYINTKQKTIFSFQETIECTIPDTAEIYIFSGTIPEIIKDYTKLFPKLKMLPEYAFGIWVSANHWNSKRDVDTLLSDLDKYNFPADVMVLEAWSDEATFYIWNGAKYKPKKSREGFGYEDFDFGESKFWNDPKSMIKKIHEKGLKLVLWQIPVFKKQDSGEEISDQLICDREYAVENQLVVKKQDGSPYEIPEGNWFSGSMIPDFTNPATKEFWFNRRKYLTEIGVDGFKTDGGEFIYDENVIFHNGMTGKEGKNQYCQEYINAYTDFMSDNQVLFSRAGYAGMSATPILWAGDHQSTNQELKNVLRAGLSAAMSGIFFWSFDIGGFAGPLPDMDLYRRSTQMAVFTPIMQWHSEPDGGQFRDLMPGAKGNNERSPWNIALANNRTEFIDEMRYWHNLRKELFPYIYNMALRTVKDDKPMMRPLIYDFEKDENVVHMEDEYLFGDNMLVAPLLEENAGTRKVYLPEGRWYDFFTGRLYEGGKYFLSDEASKMPVYVKAGTAIPVKKEKQDVIFLYGEKGKDFLDSANVKIEWERNEINVKEEWRRKAEWKFIK